MSDETIIQALAKAAVRGVDVKVAMEASTDYDATFTALESVGVQVVTYRHAPIYIHAKVIVADYGTPTATVFLGSQNFSNASLTKNRELGIITTDAATMTSLHATLASDFTGGKPFVPAASDAGVPMDASTLD
jgi:phosphatidylserine/phosphatidylglycerophosphate/cardiolipin synthase-like enzyme